MSDLARAASQAAVRNGAPTVRDLISAQQPAIEAQLAGALNGGSFVRAAMSEIAKNPNLQQATSQSVLASIMLAAQLKLEIGSALGHFWLTPRRDRGQWVCVPIVGYQGLIELAYRSGRVAKIETFLVREGDLFQYGASSSRGRFFDWTPKDRDESRPWTDVVVTAEIVGGGMVWEVLPRAKVLSRRPTGWERGPWKSHEEEMARKTAVRDVAPYLPKATELGLAVQTSRDVEERGVHLESRAGLSDLVTITSDETPAEPGSDPTEPDYEAQASADHAEWVDRQTA